MPRPVDAQGHPLRVGDYVALYLVNNASATQVVGILVACEHSLEHPAVWHCAVGSRGGKVYLEQRWSTALRWLDVRDVPPAATRWMEAAVRATTLPNGMKVRWGTPLRHDHSEGGAP